MKKVRTSRENNVLQKSVPLVFEGVELFHLKKSEAVFDLMAPVLLPKFSDNFNICFIY